MDTEEKKATATFRMGIFRHVVAACSIIKTRKFKLDISCKKNCSGIFRESVLWICSSHCVKVLFLICETFSRRNVRHFVISTSNLEDRNKL